MVKGQMDLLAMPFLFYPERNKNCHCEYEASPLCINAMHSSRLLIHYSNDKIFITQSTITNPNLYSILTWFIIFYHPKPFSGWNRD